MIKRLVFLIALFLGTFFLISCNKKKPNILIIGDSISIGYTPFVKKYFSEKATIMHNAGNAQHTGNGLEKIEKWLGKESWDVIQFNWGLWDLCYRNPEAKTHGNRDKKNGTVTFSVEEYASNLEALVTILKSKTNAKLVYVTTTYVPGHEVGRFKEDVIKYNNVAKKIMEKQNIIVNDIYDQSVIIHKKNGKGTGDVHYTTEGYKKLSEPIIKFLEKHI